MKKELIKELLTAFAEQSGVKIKAALAKGANVHCKDELGWTPLHVSCYFANLKLVEFCLANKCSIDVKNKDNATPLFFAAGMSNDVGIVKVLLKNGANPNIQTNNGLTPLIVACEKGNHDVIKSLLEAGAQIDYVYNGKSVYEYIVEKNLQVAKALVEERLLLQKILKP